MNGYWAGQTAKIITSKKKTKQFWNLFYSSALLIICCVLFIFVFQIFCENNTYEAKQIFIEYTDNHIITDTSTFKIAEANKQEIKIHRLTQNVEKGDTIVLIISKITGDLLEIKYQETVVYRKTQIDSSSVLGAAIVTLPMILLCIFMLIITNMKNPNKWVRDYQDKYILRFYK